MIAMSDGIVFVPLSNEVMRKMRTKTQEEVDAAAAEHDARDLKPAERRTYVEGSEAA